MTDTIHPCLPETYVVEVRSDSSEGYIRIPVMGWLIEGGRPLPMTLNGKHTLIGGDSAVMFPGGMVEHPSDGLAFDSVEAWLESNPGSPKKHPAKAKQEKPADPEEDWANSAYDIKFDGKPFKSNSWWHYDDGEYEFVFQVDGGEPVPKPTTKVAKIKRDDFQNLKKSLDVLSLDDINSAQPLDVEEDEDDDDLI